MASLCWNRTFQKKSFLKSFTVDVHVVLEFSPGLGTGQNRLVHKWRKLSRTLRHDKDSHRQSIFAYLSRSYFVRAVRIGTDLTEGNFDSFLAFWMTSNSSKFGFSLAEATYRIRSIWRSRFDSRIRFISSFSISNATERGRKWEVGNAYLEWIIWNLIFPPKCIAE